MPAELLIPGMILGGFALLSSTGLLIASKKFHVDEDPRIELITNLLPGANCGGCGFAGCTNYAENVVTQMKIDSPCPVAESEIMKEIGKILGLDVSVGTKQVASLMCNGTNHNSPSVMDYKGIQDCWAMSLVADSSKSCVFACMGLGSCVRACPFGAMRIEEGIVVIDDQVCSGCGICIDSCPKHLLHMRPVSKNITVTCSNTDKGADAKRACETACIGCQKCVKVCEHEAITVENFLAKINYENCDLCGKCVEACPTDSIEIRRLYADA
ncbi:MAG: RnfABCDGE type electron transport complex subunit B [Calditrichaceae bacterium]